MLSSLADMDPSLERLVTLADDVKLFFKEFGAYFQKTLFVQFLRFEAGKSHFVNALYRQRGRLARRLTHSGMASLAVLGIAIAPVIAQEFPGTNVSPWEIPSPSSVLSASTDDPSTSTQISDKFRDRVIDYEVVGGDTVSTIAGKFGISEESVRWQNSLNSRSTIKTGQILEILPVTGVIHKVRKGDTVHSISKRYDSSSQGIVDYPFNSFVNDETFELAVGQTIMVPDGVMPSVSNIARVRQFTPDAGTIVASGSFIWPTAGYISQSHAWYHKGIDIANKAAPNVLAADSGTVVVAGWPDARGYGNRVLVDHGNGFRTLYAHLSGVFVVPGQTVNRGDAVGRMGSTGRSTGVHLHFEVIRGGSYLNPLNVLR